MRFVHLAGIGSLVLLFSMLSALSAQEPPPAVAAPVDPALARVRAALGVEEFRRERKDLLLVGDAIQNGITGPVTVRLARDGRFTRVFGADINSSDGFDGATAWAVDANGMPSTVVFDQREGLLLATGSQLGFWADPDGAVVPVEFTPQGAAAATDVRVRARNGELAVVLALDPGTSLPASATFHDDESVERWSFGDWHRAGGLMVPFEFVREDEGLRNVVRFREATPVDAAPDDAFRMPTARPDDVRFDAALPARLKSHAARSGHLVAAARVNGKEVGSFIFDSGAGSWCIAPELADELRLVSFGEMHVGGAGTGRSVTHLRAASTCTLGPMTVLQPLFIELDMESLSQAFGEKVVGICGYELLMRCVAVVDMKRGAVELHDPAQFDRPGVTWCPLTLHGNHPHVDATFPWEGEETGLFRLDTGAAGIAVVFHAPTVARLDLLAGRMTTPFLGFGGVGGRSAVRQGTLDWFELGGVTFERPVALFSEDPKGAMADRWTAGTIGGVFLSRFDVIFDYPHGRVGFVEQPETRK